MTAIPTRQGVQAIERAISLIALIGRDNRTGMRANDLAQASGLSTPTVHRILKALEGAGYVERNAVSARYSLGSTITALGARASMRHDLVSVAGPSLARIVEVSEDTALLTQRQAWHSVCVARVDGTYPVRSFLTHVGDRPPLGIHSAGIAILATLSDDEITQALDHNAAEIVERFSAYVPDLIREHVQAAREAGYAFNATNKVSHGIAVTILGAGGRCVGALSIGAIPDRMQPDRIPFLAKLLHEEKRQIEARLANPPAELLLRRKM
ncbi:IclR family transcriptional regulator [Sphingobium sp. AN558]|uniref:IclR family transcriptional regulator n=1 Tax=Sphingobium sp. AN558 TaxID=3133442 RepID=UPI0030BDC877